MNNHRKTLALGAAAALIAGTAAVMAGGPSTASGSSGAVHGKHYGWPASSSRSAAQIVHSARSSAAHKGATVLTVLEVEQNSSFVDVGDPGESPGDYFLFESKLFRPGTDTAVGRDAGRCTLGFRTVMCEASGTIFHQGKLAVSGAFFSDTDARLPIIGGTGVYRNAGGTLTVKDLADGNSLLTFEITR
jgi:hypothetical protein